MSHLKILSNELTSYAGDMAPYIIEKAFKDMNLQGENIPEALRLKVVDMILERIVFDTEKHYSLRKELLEILKSQNS